MGWRRGTSEQFHVVERIRATGEGEGLSPEQMAPLIDAAIHRHLELGTIAPEDADAWRRHMAADLTGATQLLVEREQQLREAVQRTASGNGSLAAAAPRQEAEGERIVAAAIAANKFGEGRREFWLSRYRANPRETATLIDSLEPLPLVAGMPHAPRALGHAETAIGSVAPQSALRLGLRVEREHPLAPGLPGRVMAPPPRGRTNVIADKS